MLLVSSSLSCSSPLFFLAPLLPPSLPRIPSSCVVTPIVLTTALSTDTSDFQSDGLCFGFCAADWAFAVVQGKLCWCSDYIPDQGDQVGTGQCSNPCPGYPTDVCGGNNLFGYMALKKSPSGTSGSNNAGGGSSSTVSIP